MRPHERLRKPLHMDRQDDWLRRLNRAMKRQERREHWKDRALTSAAIAIVFLFALVLMGCETIERRIQYRLDNPGPVYRPAPYQPMTTVTRPDGSTSGFMNHGNGIVHQLY